MSIAFDTSYDEEKTYEDGKQHADDKKLLVRFDTRAVKNEFQTNLMGRPIFDEVEYIQIIVPGSRDVSNFPMDDGYRNRFREAYEKWKLTKKDEPMASGTLLAELPWMTKSQIAELNYCNVFTVEQLAGLSDVNAMQFMGNQKLRERAKNFLAAAEGEAVATKLQQELEQRDNQIEVLNRKINDLTSAFEKLEKQKR